MSLQRIFSVFILLLMLAAAGCGGQTAPAASAALTIDSLEVLPQEPGAKLVIVIVHGHADNNCLTITEDKLVQTGSTVEIVPQTQFTAGEACRSGSFPFDRLVSIMTSTLPEGPVEIQSGTAQVTYMPPDAETQPEAPTPETPAQEPTAEPTAVADAEPIATPPSLPSPQKDCINKAAFYDDVTVPDGTPFNPGEAFTKTWRVRNEGTCTWTDYTLIYDNSDLMGADTSNPIPAAAPGEIIDISVDMTAPSRAGAYTGNWQFKADNDETFGLGTTGAGLLWVKIGVRAVDSTEPTTTTPSRNCVYGRQTDAEEQVLSLINNARAAQGLGALTLNSKLTAAAVRHSADMACQDFVGHTGSDGSTWYTRIEAEGMTYTRASENIYVGNPSFGGTPQGAFDWWMNSQIHRDNILDPSFTKIGVGYVYHTLSAYGGYYTLVFSRP